MTKNKSKRYPAAIDDLLIEFDEMGYAPTNLCENPERKAIVWKSRLRYELDLILDEKSAIEGRAVKEFAEKLKVKAIKLNELECYHICNLIDELLKEYEK